MSVALWITLITTGLSALTLALVFGRAGYTMWRGALLGGVAGLVGPQITMVPLQYCAFDPEHAYGFTIHVFDTPYSLNAAALLAVVFIILGTWALLLLFNQFHGIYATTGRLLPPMESSPRFFKGWKWFPWLLLFPTLLAIFLFTYLPAFQTLGLATQLVRLGLPRTVPVCLDNFAQLVGGPRENAEYFLFSNGQIIGYEDAPYLEVFGVSVFYAVTVVIMANIISLAIAYAAYRKFRGANIYRVLLVWPYALSSVVTGIIFLIILSPRVGLLSQMMTAVGLPEVQFLSNPAIAPWTVALASTWNILGFNILFYIAGLQNVPSDLVEAAAVDGANASQRFRFVVIPMLSPIIFFLIFSNLTYTFFDLFGLIDKLTQGGPNNATSNLIYDVYTLGIVNKDLGKAAAQSLVLMFAVALLTLMQFRVLGRRVNYGV